MKQIPAQLVTHKAASSTTLTDLLLIGPTPTGVYVPLTLLDTDVVYDNGAGARTYKARTGVEFSTFQASNDLSVDNAEGNTLYPIAGFETEGISQDQIDAGIFDNVPFVVYRVNYTDLTTGRHEIIAGGTLGEIRRKVGGLTVLEFRSLSQQLKQTIGEVDSLSCRATFGSVAIGTGSGAKEERFPCGFDASTLWVSGIVATDVDSSEPDIGFTDSTLSQATDFFAFGLVECTAGANLGQTREIASYTTGGVFVLQFSFSNPIAIGDEFRARPGCSHLVEGNNGCRFWFDAEWVNHYRGEPYIPVADAASLLVPGAGIGRITTPTGTGEATGGGGTTTTPEPPPAGGGTTPGSPPARTIGATVVTPTLTAGSGAAASNAAAINTAFNGLPSGGGTVRIPAGTWYIDPVTSIHPVSNSRLDLATFSATLQATYTALDHKNVVTISGVHDVEVVGGSIIGYRDAWSPISGTTSEWGHGILCTSSASAVTIKNSSISKCVGDAVSLGHTSSDVVVDNCILTNCRRQGVSDGGTNNKVTNCQINHIGGTSPQAGIDREVDNPSVNSVSGATYTGNTITDCVGPAINLYKNTHSTTITGNTLRACSVGIWSTGSTGGTLTGNTIEHNRNVGLKLTESSTGWVVNTNDFFDNSNGGSETDTGTFTTRTGTSSATTDHITIDSTSSATVGANDYGP